MAVQTFTSTGSKATTQASLKKEVFNVDTKNHELVKTAYLMYLANARTNNAVTKKRGEVRGGGKKPWRQKGTGRARFGSSRNPIWRGGGITFGPTGNENYSRQLSTSSRRLALRQALSLKHAAGAVSVIEKLQLKSAKTKDAVKLVEKLNVGNSVLFVVDAFDAETSRAVANLQNVQIVTALRLATFHVMNADALVITKDGLATLETRLGDKK